MQILSAALCGDTLHALHHAVCHVHCAIVVGVLCTVTSVLCYVLGRSYSMRERELSEELRQAEENLRQANEVPEGLNRATSFGRCG